MSDESHVHSKALRLDVGDWVDYFSSLQVNCERWLACVELGSPTAKEERPDPRSPSRPFGRPLRTIGYDPHADELEIAVGGGVSQRPSLRYFVSSPRAITVEEFDHTRAVLVDDSNGDRTLIRFFGLPAPGTALRRGHGERVRRPRLR